MLSTQTIDPGSAHNLMNAHLLDHAPLGVFVTDPLGRIASVNAHLCTLLGRPDVELIGRMASDMVLDHDLDAFLAAQTGLDATAGNVSVEVSLSRNDGQVIVTNCTLTGLRDRSGKPNGMMAVILDISERVSLERRLRDSEARLRQVLDNTVAMIGILQTDGTLIEANMPALSGAGLSRGDVIGKKFWDCYWWRDNPAEVARMQDAIADATKGHIQRYDAEVRMEGDSTIWIDFMLSPVFDDDGDVSQLIASAFDISDRKRTEKRVTYAMREVNHRSKNLLAVVQSMLRQMRPTNLDDFVHGFGQRLRALSDCQELLLKADDEDPLLEDLIQSQLAPFGSSICGRVRLHGPDLHIRPETAQSMGMAVYELITNASKYGALSGDSGEIDITWTLEPPSQDQDETFTLSWREQKGPKVTPPEKRGFGSMVLEDMMAMALTAQTRTDYAPEGLHWSLRAPRSAIEGTD